MAKPRVPKDGAAANDPAPTVTTKEPKTDERRRVIASYIETLKAVMKAVRNKLHF